MKYTKDVVDCIVSSRNRDEMLNSVFSAASDKLLEDIKKSCSEFLSLACCEFGRDSMRVYTEQLKGVTSLGIHHNYTAVRALLMQFGKDVEKNPNIFSEKSDLIASFFAVVRLLVTNWNDREDYKYAICDLAPQEAPVACCE